MLGSEKEPARPPVARFDSNKRNLKPIAAMTGQGLGRRHTGQAAANDDDTFLDSR